MDKTPDIATLDEITVYLRHDQWKARKLFEKWQKSVEMDAKKRGFFSSKNAIIPFILGTLLIAVVFSLFHFLLLFVVAIAALIPNALFPNILPNRSLKGAAHYKRWMMLKAFLSDFSNLRSMPPDAVVLWEKYLVYSIPLGVAKKVQKPMDEVFRDYRGEYHSAIFVGASYSSFSAAGFGSAVGSFSSAFNTASGTSGGGGFAGGGGAGGGGGGGGAG